MNLPTTMCSRVNLVLFILIPNMCVYIAADWYTYTECLWVSIYPPVSFYSDKSDIFQNGISVRPYAPTHSASFLENVGLSVQGDYDKSLNLDVGDALIVFHDFKNKINVTSPIDRAADLIITSHNLQLTRKLIIYVPCFGSRGHDEQLITQIFQDVPNIYLIIFDIRPYTSSRGNEDISYPTAVLNSYYLGRAFGKFLAKLKARGYPSKNFHCIGYSLGAQILGYTGEAYTNETKEKIWRITGLDPAGWCFSESSIQEQLRSGVAEYVEVYHCNAGGIGTKNVLADADFFFNEGSMQPHCNGMSCSHQTCLKYWTQSVHNPGLFSGRKCHSYQAFKSRKCAGSEVTTAGYHNPGTATGVFYISTEDNIMFP